MFDVWVRLATLFITGRRIPRPLLDSEEWGDVSVWPKNPESTPRFLIQDGDDVFHRMVE